jgi:hypothetical protein
MKTMSNLSKTLLVVALTVAAAVALPSVLLAQEKGAQKLLGLKSAKAAPAAEAAVMSCPKCKDSYVTVLDKSIRGANANQKATVVVHGCPTCDTKLTTKGVGKAATDVVSHSCGMTAKGPSCCAAKK